MIDKNTRNTLVDLFLTCRQKWQLSQEWVPIEDDEALSIGLCVHAALAVWQFGGSDEAAYGALLEAAKDLHPPEVKVVVLEKATSLCTRYFTEYRNARLKMVSAETPLAVSLGNGWTYRTRLDGLCEYNNKIWITSYKTTSMKPGIFFTKYAYDRQALGEMWSVRQALPEIPVVGMLLDVLFKAESVPFERRFFEWKEPELKQWYEETLAITADMAGPDDIGPRIYRADNYTCIRGSRICEFWQSYCSLGMDEKLLASTHSKKTNLGLLPWRKEQLRISS